MDRHKKHKRIDAESAAELAAAARGAADGRIPSMNITRERSFPDKKPTKRSVRRAAVLKSAQKHAPAAFYGAFCAAISATPFAFETYPFGFALLAAAEGREFVVAALAGIVVGSAFVDGGGFVTLAALIIAAARLLIDALDRRRALRASRAKSPSEDEIFPAETNPADSAQNVPRAAHGAKLVHAAKPDDKNEKRGVFARAVFREELPVRCALAAAGAIVTGGIGLLFHANVWRAIAAVVLSASVAPVFCAAFAGFFKNGADFADDNYQTDDFDAHASQARYSDRRNPLRAAPPDGKSSNANSLAFQRRRFAWSACALAVLFAASWTLSGISVGAIRLGAAFALLCSLVGAHFLPVPEAAFASFAVSLPLDFAVIPAIMLAACAYSLVRRHFPLAAAAAGGAAAIFFSLGAAGLAAASRYGGSFILASVLAIPTARAVAALPERLPPRFAERVRVILGPSAQIWGSGGADGFGRSVRELRSLSDCFLSLGDLAGGIARALAAPPELQVRERVTRVFEQRCASCAHRDRCDSADYRAALARAIRRGEGTASVAVPSGLSRRCAELGAILRAVSPDTDDDGATAAFARDVSSLGSLLADVSDRLGAENVRDEAASLGLRRALTSAGIFAAEVSVVSPRLRLTRISGLDPASFPGDGAALTRLVSRTLGCEMTEPKIAVAPGGLDVTLRAREKLRVVVGRCSVSASSAPCGDSSAAFVARDGCFRALISDGMGSGTEAAFTAGTVALFLERLLSAGVQMSSALRITNSFLRDRKIECSATVDVAEIDLIGGSAHFFKSGAAPSFVLRGGKLFKLRSRTVPIGILPDADAEAISFGVLPGDVIVMTSDGVTRDSEDCPWLYDALCTERITDLTAAARRIADEAKRRSPDDVTVMLLRVEQA